MISLPRIAAPALILLIPLLLLLACGSDEPAGRSESSRSERTTSPASSSQSDRAPGSGTTPPAEESDRARSIFSRTSAETDREALVALYHATGGPDWLHDENWLSDKPLSQWYRVDVDDDERVTGLYLSGNNLTGEIPPEIANLDNLTVLDLQQNLLSGEIPPELGNLRSLKFLVIPLNQLSGEIPVELGGLADLEMLAVNNNRLSGPIPRELGQLSSLKALTLNDNRLTGEIPPELGGLAGLTDLNLQNNRLGGEMPTELGDMRGLKNLWLTGNRLRGEIPAELGNLENLESLLLGDNMLEGEIPASLGGLPRLNTLGLHLNQLSGEIPRELGSIPDLETLALGGNQLSGWLPPELGNLSRLAILGLAGNPLEGCVPNNLERQLDMSQSNLGYLPYCNVMALATPSTPRATTPPSAQATRLPPQATSAPTPLPRATGGPGAVYRGDGHWLALVGPSVEPVGRDNYFGGFDNMIPLYSILQHQWIYESDYYQSLVRKARLNNPTALSSSGRNITLQFACVNRNQIWCRFLEAYFVPNVAKRTDGQINIEVSSLGPAAQDTADLLTNGTVAMAEVHGGYVGGEFPAFVIQELWGLWTDQATHFQAQASIAPDLDQVVEAEMGAVVLFRNWIAGNDQFIFSHDELETPDDFRDLVIHSDRHEMSDWITGMGGESRFVDLVQGYQVYDDLERRQVDAAATDVNTGYWQRHYEVAGYMNGPLYGMGSTINVINREVWDDIPSDLQQILVEEGARNELEALRVAAIQNLTGMERIIDEVLEYVEFSPEIRAKSRRAARECVIPGWLQRMGYSSAHGCVPTPASTLTAAESATMAARASRAVDIFNSKVGPIVGLRIEPDGTVTDLK